MKIKSLGITNIRSFRDPVTVDFDGNVNIFVGPNGGGKSNLLDILNVTLRHYIVRPYLFKTQPDAGKVHRDLESATAYPSIQAVLERYTGDTSPSLICLELIVDQGDADNMKLLHEKRAQLAAALSSYRNKAVGTLEFLESSKTLQRLAHGYPSKYRRMLESFKHHQQPPSFSRTSITGRF